MLWTSSHFFLKVSTLGVVAPVSRFNHSFITPGPEPPIVELDRIYTDYMKYLMDHTKHRLVEVAGSDLWSEHLGQVEVVLTHPNLWRPDQRRILQESAVRAGLIPLERASEHVHFIEEAQAAARYCVSKYSTHFNDLKVSLCCTPSLGSFLTGSIPVWYENYGL